MIEFLKCDITTFKFAISSELFVVLESGEYPLELRLLECRTHLLADDLRTVECDE